jgi:hypothetical protein
MFAKERAVDAGNIAPSQCRGRQRRCGNTPRTVLLNRRCRHLSARLTTSINSAILRRWSALSPDEIACSTQWATWSRRIFLLDAAQRRPRRRDLGDDVDAVAVALHHAGEAANLASTRFAFLYNAARVPIAAGALYPLFGVLLSPMVGAAAMALSPVSVIAKALRLARTELG